MAQKLSVSLSGDIDLKQDSATCPGGVTDVGEGFKFSLLDVNRQADIEISQKLAVVDATGGPVALPFPGNLDGRFFYMKVLSGGPFTVDVAFATQGSTPLPLKGVMLIEPSDSESVLGVTISTGAGAIEWLVTGKET